jgi:cyclic beta-1,2-glucan synthetase
VGPRGLLPGGGAYGFATSCRTRWAALIEPALLREQVLLHASRQFREGDVQHWWHPPAGAACDAASPTTAVAAVRVRALRRGHGDAAVLDAERPWLDGAAVPPHAEDAYYLPHVTATETRCTSTARARSTSASRVGAHGLPLMGAGDWNDGMNRVGGGGRGESVWLAWFSLRGDRPLRPLARRRGDDARVGAGPGAGGAARRAAHARLGRRVGTAAPISTTARRSARTRTRNAGSTSSRSAGPCCPAPRSPTARGARCGRPHSIWSTTTRTSCGCSTRRSHDPDHDPATSRTIPPACARTAASTRTRAPGRSMAFAALGEHDAAYRAFTYLSPAHRAAPRAGRRYELEPYAMAGDVYTRRRSSAAAAGAGTPARPRGCTAPPSRRSWPSRSAATSRSSRRGCRRTGQLAEITYRHGASRYTFVCTPDDALAGDCERVHAAGEAIALVDDGRAHRLRITCP